MIKMYQQLLIYFSPFFPAILGRGAYGPSKNVILSLVIVLSLRSMDHTTQNRQKLAKNKRATFYPFLLVMFYCSYFHCFHECYMYFFKLLLTTLQGDHVLVASVCSSICVCGIYAVHEIHYKASVCLSVIRRC